MEFNRLKTVSAINYVSGSVCLRNSLIRDVIETKNFTPLKQDYCYFLRQWNFFYCSEERTRLSSQGVTGSWPWLLGHPLDVLESLCSSLPAIAVCNGGCVGALLLCERLGLRLVKWGRASTWVTLSNEGETPRLGWYRERASDIKASRQTSPKCVSEQVQEGRDNEKKDK